MVEAPHIRRTAFASFEKGVATMLERNGVTTPPGIEIREGVLQGTPAAAYPPTHMFPRGKIVVAPGFASQGETILTMGTIAHETGHVLERHHVGIGFGNMLVDTANPWSGYFLHPFNGPVLVGKSQAALSRAYKTQEHEADRIMTHFLGSQEDALSVRKALTPGSEFAPYYNATTSLSGLHSPLIPEFQRQTFHTLYGTPEELEANIRSVNLKDRSHVDRLIALREASLANARTK